MKDIIVAMLVSGAISIPALAGELKLVSSGAIPEGHEADSESIDRSVNACVQAARVNKGSAFSAKWNDVRVVYDGTPEEEFAFRLCMRGMGYGPGVRAGEEYQYDER